MPLYNLISMALSACSHSVGPAHTLTVKTQSFWESLEGQLVQIPSPVSLNFPNQYGEFWVYGAWNVTGKNARGGLTITFGENSSG